MSKRAANRADKLAGDLPSPRILPAIDKALQDNAQERLDLLDLRKMAVRRHGETAPLVIAPETPSQIVVESPAAPPIPNEPEAFDGTIHSLVNHYQSDSDSPYQSLRYRTKENYRSLLRRIERDIGPNRIKDLDARRITRIHEAWKRDGHIAMAHSLVTMLRALSTFGASFLKSKECRELRTTLSEMQFDMPKPRFNRLTAEQANLIRAMAHKMGRPSIALAQAFQFDCMLRQRDVIGEWVPMGEQDSSSNIIHAGNEWLRGLRWEEIGNFILRRADNPDFDLRQAPMVMDELGKRQSPLPSSGPVVVCEFSRLPWTSYEFRRWWRKVADACEIPKEVKNMDSRQREDIPQKYVSPRYRKRRQETEKDRPAGGNLRSAGRVH
jgi:hypothetical protein